MTTEITILTPTKNIKDEIEHFKLNDVKLNLKEIFPSKKAFTDYLQKIYKNLKSSFNLIDWELTGNLVDVITSIAFVLFLFSFLLITIFPIYPPLFFWTILNILFIIIWTGFIYLGVSHTIKGLRSIMKTVNFREIKDKSLSTIKSTKKKIEKFTQSKIFKK